MRCPAAYTHPIRLWAGPGVPSCGGGSHLRGYSAQRCPGLGSVWAQVSRGFSLGCSCGGSQGPADETPASLSAQDLANSVCQRGSSTGRHSSICVRLGTAEGPRWHTPELPEHPDPVLMAPLQKGRASGQAPLWWGPLRALRTRNHSAEPCAQEHQDPDVF